MQEQVPPRSSKVSRRNFITAVCLSLLIFFTIQGIFDTGYENHMEVSPSIAWGIISSGLTSGILYFDPEGALFLAAFFFFPLGIWSFIALRRTLVEYRRREGSTNKASVVWAVILFGVNILLFACLLYVPLSHACVPVSAASAYETDPRCRLPLRPGIVIPAPLPYPGSSTIEHGLVTITTVEPLKTLKTYGRLS